MDKGDFPCRCCLWLLQAAAVLLGASNRLLPWFVCLTALSDGLQREWRLSAISSGAITCSAQAEVGIIQ